MTRSIAPAPPEVPATPFDDGELYDLLFGAFDYGVDFYLGLAKEAGGPVLDLACGTGRVLLPMLESGIDAEGVDLHAPMLARLTAKAAQKRLAAPVHRGDMRSFAVPRRFALVVIPFNSFGHCLTTADQLAALRRCLDQLLPGGLLAFDAFFPGRGYLTQPDGARTLELETRDPRTGEAIRLYDTRFLDPLAQVQRSEIEVELGPAGAPRETRRSVTDVRWTFPAEMHLLLDAAGFARREIVGGFDRRPLSNDGDGMVVLAWKEGAR